MNIFKIPVSIFFICLYSTVILYSQSGKTYVFTEEEVIELQNQMIQLEEKNNRDSLIINNLNGQLQLYLQQTNIDSIIIENYKEQLALKEDLIKELKPKWYDNKYLWYTGGVLSMILPIWAVGQIN